MTTYTNELLLSLGYAKSELELARRYCEARDRYDSLGVLATKEEIAPLRAAWVEAKNALHDFQVGFRGASSVSRS